MQTETMEKPRLGGEEGGVGVAESKRGQSEESMLED